MTIIRLALLICGAYAWSLCLREHYSLPVGIAATAVAATLYTMLGSEVKSKITHWSLAMVGMLAGGSILWHFGIP